MADKRSIQIKKLLTALEKFLLSFKLFFHGRKFGNRSYVKSEINVDPYKDGLIVVKIYKIALPPVLSQGRRNKMRREK